MIPRLAFLFLLLAMPTLSQMPPIEPGVSEELAKWRATQYSNIRYKLNLTLEKMSSVLRGSIEIHVTQAAYACAEPYCPPMAFILDWRKIPGHEKDSTIAEVTINGNAVMPDGDWGGNQIGPGYFIYNDHLVIYGGGMGENVIKLDFTSPILTSGSAITRYIDKEDGSEYIYSLFVPSDASTAFPVFDQPDLKARFQLTVEKPKDWTVVSNSRRHFPSSKCLEVLPKKPVPLGEQPDAAKVAAACDEFEFEVTKPISTYVFAFAAGPFANFREDTKDFLVDDTNLPKDPDKRQAFIDGLAHPEGNPSFVFVRKSQAAKFKPHAAEVFRLQREAVKYLETYFDYKFPWPKYDLVLIPEFPFGGMEHAGATFLREDRVIFPAEPTANDYITRANVIFHETAHQWFGDCVTMQWFDDLWLKEGFAEFMAYKTLEHVMPEYNAWKAFYERNKQAAYATDSTKGTTAIYQPIRNLSSAKSAYGNIVYRKAPSFLRQAEFYLGEDKFQTAVQAFLKKHEFGNATWQDLVNEFENARTPGTAQAILGDRADDMSSWAKQWVTVPGVPIIRTAMLYGNNACYEIGLVQQTISGKPAYWRQKFLPLIRFSNASDVSSEKFLLLEIGSGSGVCDAIREPNPIFLMPNYRDYGYGIFLLDDKSRDYVLKNIQNEKDPFLRSMMWGALWDSVREAELDPREYVELVIKVLSPGFSRPTAKERPPKGGTQNASQSETDETTIQSLLGRVSTALNYYLSDAKRAELTPKFEAMLLDRLQHSTTTGQKVTFYRAFVSSASSVRARSEIKGILVNASVEPRNNRTHKYIVFLKTKDKFDIVTRLAILGDPDAPKLLAELEKTETSDDAKRYAYAAHAAFGTAENKARFWNDFVNNKDISESWIEGALGPFNAISQSELTLPHLERSLALLPTLKRDRKIFFVNDWLAAFIGGQRKRRRLPSSVNFSLRITIWTTICG